MTDGRSEMRLSLPGEARRIPPARKAILAFCRGGGWKGRALEELGLALTEVANNAIEHGGGTEGSLRIHLDVRPDRIVLRIAGGRAEHIGALRRALENSGDLPEDGNDRGRGLFLVRCCVDRVQVRTAGGTVVVRMVKDRSRPR